MILDRNDRDGPLWHKLKAHLEAKLENLRAKNDKHASDLDTARLRGRIAEVKALLSLGSDKPIIESEEELFKD